MIKAGLLLLPIVLCGVLSPNPSLTNDGKGHSAFKVKAKQDAVLAQKEHLKGEEALTPLSREHKNNGMRCVYIHGIGSKDPEPPVKFTQFLSSEAREKTHPPVLNQVLTKHCAEVIQYTENTCDQAWFDEKLYSRICNIASAEAADGVIRNTHVFSGSMGTLIFAAGIEAGKCSLDSTSRWHVLGSPPASIAPLAGTHIHAMREQSMQEMVTKVWAPHTDLIGQATGIYLLNQNNEFGRSYQCLMETENCADPVSPEKRDAVNKIISTQVSSAMCGRCPGGVQDSALGKLAEQLAFLTAPSKVDTDAAVTYDQCRFNFADKTFSQTPTTNFYAPCANHFDVLGYSDDGTSDDKKPMAWVENILVSS